MGQGEKIGALDVSRETMARLREFEVLLRKWTKKINLVSNATLDDAWTRHIIDSAQVFEIAPKARHWVDLGTGGGFPGLVCAALAAELSPDCGFTFVESDQRKAAFLRSAARELGLKVTVSATRIEETPPLGADVITARALAPLSKLLGLTEPHLSEGGVAIFLKGENWRAEVEESLEHWRFSLIEKQSRTSRNAAILSIRDIECEEP